VDSIIIGTCIPSGLVLEAISAFFDLASISEHKAAEVKLSHKTGFFGESAAIADRMGVLTKTTASVVEYRLLTDILLRVLILYNVNYT